LVGVLTTENSTVTITRTTIEGNGEAGLYARGSADVTLDTVIARNGTTLSSPGIQLQGNAFPPLVRLTDVVVVGHHDHAIELTGGAATAFTYGNNKLHGNVPAVANFGLTSVSPQ
jgi:hypothetical protein